MKRLDSLIAFVKPHKVTVDKIVASDIFRSSLVCFVAYLVFRVFFAYRVPFACYESAVPSLCVITQKPLLLLLLLPGLALWRLKWDDFGEPRIRYLIATIFLIVSLEYTLDEYNYFFDSYFAFERLALIFTSVMVIKRPAFAIPALFFSFVLYSSYFHPIPAAPTTAIRSCRNAMYLIIGFLLVSRKYRLSSSSLLLLLLSSQAVLLVVPGLAKLELGNWMQNDLGTLFMNSWLHGWKVGLTEQAALSLSNVVSQLSPFLVFMTMVAELTAVFFMANKFLCIAILVLAIGLHFAIYASSGILFFPWILFDIALIIWILRVEKHRFNEYFSIKKRAAEVCVVMLLIYNFLGAPWLGWYDVPVDTKYTIRLVQKNGEQTTISQSFFAPYDIFFLRGGRKLFTLENRALMPSMISQQFYYTSGHYFKKFAGSIIRGKDFDHSPPKSYLYVSANGDPSELNTRLSEITTLEELKFMQNKHGKNRYSEKRNTRIRQLLKTLTERKLTSRAWIDNAALLSHGYDFSGPRYLKNPSDNPYQYVTVAAHEWLVLPDQVLRSPEREVLRVALDL